MGEVIKIILEEKLMKLRKENVWSKEEFADKLNV